MKKILFFFYLVIFLLPLLKATTFINSCGVLNIEGEEYVLTRDIETNGSCFIIQANNVTLNGRGHKIIGKSNGFGINITNADGSNIENITIENFSICIYLNHTANTTVKNSVMRACEEGIDIGGGVFDGKIMGNIITNTSSYGIGIDSRVRKGGRGNLLIEDNIIENNFGDGIYIVLYSNNVIANNIIRNNTHFSGIYLSYGANNSKVINNTIIHSGRYGIGIDSINGGIFQNNTIKDAMYCFYSILSSNVMATRLIIENCSEGGMYFLASQNITIENSTISNSTKGINGINSNNTFLKNIHLFANYYYIYLQSSRGYEWKINGSNVTLDNPGGNFENFTSLDISTLVYGDSNTIINYSSPPSPLPGVAKSFRNKWIKIIQRGKESVIDYMAWKWGDGELRGVNEGLFQLWMKNGSDWVVVNTTPDVQRNQLALSHFYPSNATYGIMERTSITCMKIVAPGYYKMKKNVIGAPIPADPLGGSACFKIEGSNITLDCQGKSIINNETLSQPRYGVLVLGRNVTIVNCSIINYTSAVMIRSGEAKLEKSRLLSNIFGINALFGGVEGKNLSIYENDDGILLNLSSATIEGANISNNNGDGVVILNSSNVSITTSLIENNGGDGIALVNGNNIDITNCQFRKNRGKGINGFGGERARIEKNIFLHTGETGVLLYSFNNSNILGNYFLNSSAYHVYVETCENVVIEENTGNKSTNEGILVKYCKNVSIESNNLSNNGENGIFVGGVENGEIDNNFLRNSPKAGIFLTSSKYIRVENNTAKNTTYGVVGLNDSEFLITGNHFSRMVRACVYLSNIRSNGGVEKNTCHDSFIGEFIINSNNVNSKNNTIFSTNYGLVIYSANSSAENDNIFSSVYGSVITWGSNTNLNNLHIYNNSYDIYMTTSRRPALVVNLSHVVIDNPLGNYKNYTILYLNDYVPSNTEMLINWSSSPPSSAFPTDIHNFKGWVKIEGKGNKTIDYLAFGWEEREERGHNEKAFLLGVYNGSNLTLINATLEENKNIIWVRNLKPSSDYGIVENTTLPPHQEGGRGGGEECKEIEIKIEKNCSTNVVEVFVYSEGEGVEGRIIAKGEDYKEEEGLVDGKAQFHLPPAFSPTTYTLHFPEQEGYCEKEFPFKFQSCYPNCESNDQCREDEICQEGLCKKIECECGWIEEHSCRRYECCGNGECNESTRCVNHRCVPRNITLILEKENISQGEYFQLLAFEDGKPAENVTLIAIYPNGITLLYPFSSNLSLLAPQIGKYKFRLKEGGNVVLGYAALERKEPITKAKLSEEVIKEEKIKEGKQKRECCLFGICMKILGICWYWWALLIIVATIFIWVVKNKKRGKRWKTSS